MRYRSGGDKKWILGCTVKSRGVTPSPVMSISDSIFFSHSAGAVSREPLPSKISRSQSDSVQGRDLSVSRVQRISAFELVYLVVLCRTPHSTITGRATAPIFLIAANTYPLMIPTDSTKVPCTITMSGRDRYFFRRTASYRLTSYSHTSSPTRYGTAPTCTVEEPSFQKHDTSNRSAPCS